MHLPIVNSGDRGTIKNNTDEFIDYCKKNNVRLILAGHSHKNKVYNANGEIPYTAEKPLFIQTVSATKDSDPYDHGYRIIKIQNGKESYTNKQFTPEKKVIVDINQHDGLFNNRPHVQLEVCDSGGFSNCVTPDYIDGLSTDFFAAAGSEKIIVYDQLKKTNIKTSNPSTTKTGEYDLLVEKRFNDHEKGVDVFKTGNADHFSYEQSVLISRKKCPQFDQLAKIMGCGKTVEQLQAGTMVDATLILGAD